MLHLCRVIIVTITIKKFQLVSKARLLIFILFNLITKTEVNTNTGI